VLGGVFDLSWLLCVEGVEIMGEVVHVDFRHGLPQTSNTTPCEIIHVDFVGSELVKCIVCGANKFHLIDNDNVVCTNCEAQLEFVKGAEVEDD
jgi:hypothetical protein